MIIITIIMVFVMTRRFVDCLMVVVMSSHILGGPIKRRCGIVFVVWLIYICCVEACVFVVVGGAQHGCGIGSRKVRAKKKNVVLRERVL